MLLSVRDVSVRLRMSQRQTRQYLQRLHEKHGGLLFRHSNSARAKLWVDPSSLARIVPGRFGELSDSANLIEIHGRLEAAFGLIEDLRGEVRDLRSELAESRKRG